VIESIYSRFSLRFCSETCIHVGMDFLRLAELRNTVSLTERGSNAAVNCG
jgi:hypothetical protein